MDRSDIEGHLRSCGWVVTAKDIPTQRWHLTASEPTTGIPLLSILSQEGNPHTTTLASIIRLEPRQKDAYNALSAEGRKSFRSQLDQIIRHLAANTDVVFDVETESETTVGVGRVPSSIYFAIDIPDNNLSAVTLASSAERMLGIGSQLADCIGGTLGSDNVLTGASRETGKSDGPWLEIIFPADQMAYFSFMSDFTQLLGAKAPNVGVDVFISVHRGGRQSYFASPSVSEATVALFRRHGATESAPPDLSRCKRLVDKVSLKPLSLAKPAASPSARPATPPRRPIDRLYKYQRRKYGEALARAGVLRIGTLYDFRRIELGPGIADPLEGLKEITHHIDEFYTGDAVGLEDTEHGRALKQLGLLEGIVDPRKLYFKDFTQRARVQFPNSYVHCTSDQCSLGTMREFDGADSCVEILDPDLFYQYITETLSAVVGPVKFLDLCRVEYANRTERWNGFDQGLAPVLLKDPRYAPQHECRAIWVPQTAPSAPLEPVIITDSRIPNVCRIVATIPD